MMSNEDFTGLPVLEVTEGDTHEIALEQARSVLAASHKATLNDSRPHVVYEPPTTVVNQEPLPVNHIGDYAVPVPIHKPVHKGPRRVRLTVSRIDPWSVMKLAFLLSVALGIMTVVAVALFWLVIDRLQVFATLQDFINEAVGAATVNITQYFEFGRIISLATLVAVVNVVILTILAAIMAILYNITSTLVGGLRVTLTDD